MSEPITVILPQHPDEVMMRAVADAAERTYGETPQKQEAIGFFFTAYNLMVKAHLADIVANGD